MQKWLLWGSKTTPSLSHNEGPQYLSPEPDSPFLFSKPSEGHV